MRYSATRLAPLLALLILGSLPAPSQDVRHKDLSYEVPKYGSLEEWLGRAHELRKHILLSTGLEPALPRGINVVYLAPETAAAGVTIQSLALETMPGLYLVGTLFRPSSGDGPFPAVLTPHGHWDDGRLQHSESASIPGRSISLARHGFVVLAYSMIGYNETAGAVEHRFADAAYDLWGFSPAGLQLWNSLHALDYLLTLPEVDADRIGVTGASGGGTQTFLLTAIDERVAVSAPVNMISAHFQGGCVCENPPLLRVDATNLDIGALAAPRPLLLISTSGDWTANTPEVEFPAIRAIYGRFDAADRVSNVHLDYPHNYNRDSREAMYEWFARWLKGEPGWSEQEIPLLADSLLLAKLPRSPAGADELFLTFKGAVSHQMPQAAPVGMAALTRFLETYGAPLRALLAAGAAPSLSEVTINRPDSWTEAGPVRLIVARKSDAADAEIAVLEEQALSMGHAVARLALDDFPALDFPAEQNFLSTYNPTPDARAVRAIAAVAEALTNRADFSEVHLTGIGSAGAPVLLGAALYGRAASVQVDLRGRAYEQDSDYIDTAAIPLLRRLGGLQTASALIFPARLDVAGLPIGGLRDWLERLYGANGLADKLVVR